LSAQPTIVVRTTCTEAVGFGHYRRCLTLAAEARKTVHVVFAVTVDERGRQIVTADGHRAGLLAQTETGTDATLAVVAKHVAAALVVDDYALTSAAIAALHAKMPNLLVLDDGLRRELDVDALLDANPTAPQIGYALPPGALQLLGARYALLRPEFRGLPARQVATHVDRVLVTLGGSNPDGRTGPIAEKLLAALPQATVEVVAGPLFRGELPDSKRLVVHRSPRDMVDLMLRADLAIAAGGQTTYELAACGVPTLALCVAENQRENLAALASVPALRVASDDTFVDDVTALAADATARQRLVDGGQALFDGRGAERAWAELATRWFGGAR
jgi:UDP-2,4-diacetamido-2,4,6-trideoxy-beta-L-altropyranose hydrolase